jgi:isocitrate dehydrogenase (NAD+)
MSRTVTLLPGDGIGPEVVDATLEVLAATGVEIDWEPQLIGGPALDAGAGTPLPSAAVESVRRNGLALKGPLTTLVGRGQFPSPNIGLRRELDLVIQARPLRGIPIGRPGPAGFDVVVVRQTSEDLYAGLELAAGSDQARQVLELAGAGDSWREGTAVSLKPFSPAAVERSATAAARWAAEADRSRITVVHKASVMRESDGLFLRTALSSAQRDGIEVDDALVDAVAARLVLHPEQFDVLFTGNLYGDILSDLTAAVAGGIGLAPGVNLGPEAAVFEAAHGSAPRHAGTDRVNPIGMVRSGAMLLRHLGESEAAARVEAAVDDVLREGRFLTYDVAVGEPVGTAACAAAISARVRAG